MAAGFEVYCQDGSGMLQIDGSYQNLHQRRSGSAATTTTYFSLGGNVVTYVTVNLGNFSRRPLLAVSSGSPYFHAPVYQRSDGAWEVQIYLNAGIGSQFTWYAYDTVAAGEESNYGCVVYDPTGTVVVADLARRMMRVASAFTIVYNGDLSDITLPAGRSYAVAISGGGRMQPASAGASVLLYNGASVSGNIIRRSIFQIAAISASSVAQTRVSYCLALDVTNY